MTVYYFSLDYRARSVGGNVSGLPYTGVTEVSAWVWALASCAVGVLTGVATVGSRSGGLFEMVFDCTGVPRWWVRDRLVSLDSCVAW